MKYADKIQQPDKMMYGPTRHIHTHRVPDDFTDEQWERRCEKFGIRHRFHRENPKQRIREVN